MSVKQVFDHSLRATGKRFLSSLKASNRYSGGYLASLETTLAMAALYAEEQGWPDVQEITTEHIEDYLSYLQDRDRWFGERTYADPRKLSKGHINAQYRRRNRSFNWLVERKHIDENPLDDIEAPSLEEKTVPIVTEDQMRDLLTLTDPALARTPAHRFRLVRDRAVLYAFWDTPGRLSEIAKLRLEHTDLANGTLLVMGKGRKERKMPIGDTARSAIWDYLQEREALIPLTTALWVSEQGEALLPNGICQLPSGFTSGDPGEACQPAKDCKDADAQRNWSEFTGIDWYNVLVTDSLRGQSMVSFEQAFSDMERAAASTAKSATDLTRLARALEKAAKDGNIAAAKRAQRNMSEAINALRQEVANSVESWPFGEDEEQQYLTDDYGQELRAVAAGKGLDIYERDGRMIAHPSVVRVLPSSRAVRIDRKQVSNIRPSRLTDILLDIQRKPPRFPAGRFLESLYLVYSEITREEGPDRMVAAQQGRVVELDRVYRLLTSQPGSDREYNRTDFTRDLYLLDQDGPKTTSRGLQVSFPASSGTRSGRGVFSFVAPGGQVLTYYGIQFSGGN